MLIVKEGKTQYLAMGIKDADTKCLPAPITAKFKLAPIVFAGDNMNQGIRTLPKPKELTE